MFGVWRENDPKAFGPEFETKINVIEMTGKWTLSKPPKSINNLRRVKRRAPATAPHSCGT
jgi:hypothetical protein